VGYRHSLCHGWSSGPTPWLSRTVLGITPAVPGFTLVRIVPKLGTLKWAEGSYPTPLGLIQVRHERQADGSIKTRGTVPPGMTVENAKSGEYEVTKIILTTADYNLALDGTATQSSTGYKDAIAARAIDGNTDGTFFNNSVTHTGSDANAWWQVDLGENCVIRKINCFNRTDADAQRASNYDIKIGTDGSTWPTVLHQADVMGTPTEIKLDNVTGRYVRIQLRSSNILTLAEVEVWGRPVSATGAKTQDSALKEKK
jgi:hypothetical protein